MARLQRLPRAVLPSPQAADMEAESRAWLLRCPCGHARPVWDAAGVRWKASGKPVRSLK